MALPPNSAPDRAMPGRWFARESLATALLIASGMPKPVCADMHSPKSVQDLGIFRWLSETLFPYPTSPQLGGLRVLGPSRRDMPTCLTAERTRQNVTSPPPLTIMGYGPHAGSKEPQMVKRLPRDKVIHGEASLGSQGTTFAKYINRQEVTKYGPRGPEDKNNGKECPQT
jgi:hypothetical protein